MFLRARNAPTMRPAPPAIRPSTVEFLKFKIDTLHRPAIANSYENASLRQEVQIDANKQRIPYQHKPTGGEPA